MSTVWLLIGIVCGILVTFSKQSSLSTVKEHKYLLHTRSITARESCQTPDAFLGSKINTTDRLRRLRLRMKASSYDAYIVLSSDEHQSEFVADHDKRREFISGFTGSAGTAVILAEQAALWTDGRYFIQAEKELDCNWLLMKKNEKGIPTVSEWIIQNLLPNQRVGADPKVLSFEQWLHLQKELEKANLTLAEDSSNLIDDIWNIPQGRVPESIAHIFVHDIKYAGKSWEDKIKEVRERLEEKKADATIVMALDEIAWLFNLRGHDIPYTPVFKAYAFIGKNHARLYIKRLKLTPEVERHLCPKISNESECLQIVDYINAFHDMRKLVTKTQKILLPTSSSYAIINLVPEDKRIISNEPSIVSTLKVVKNAVEITGMKNAALKDSVAIVDFIAMLDEQVQKGKHWDEIKAAKTLAKFRQEQELNQGESFSAISAVGSNGAIIHYHPEVLTNRNINSKHLYLLDSGGQYLDGSTDITRTFHFGEPNEFEMAAYTRVLMGAIDLMTTVFPDTVRGMDLDILARQPLYRIGLDYLHGTGHGIGHFLSIHEGPIGISNPARKRAGYLLEPGMFLSDEPGYYEKGKFGIRLETMMMVVKAPTPYHFNDLKFYTFEPVSFVPFEPKLIDLSVLSQKQTEWLNWFNMKTRNTVGIELQKQGRERGLKWLLSKTEYIPVHNCPNHCPGVICDKSYLYVFLMAVVIIFL